MHYNFSASLNKYAIKGLLPVLFILLLLSSLNAGAQHRRDPWNHFGGGGNGGGSPDSGYGITFSTSYDAPTGDLANSFKAAPAFNLDVVNYRGKFTFNVGIGYHAYQPKADTLFYDDGAGGVGTIAYKQFPVYAFYAGAAYNIDITDGFRLYVGANFGYYFTHYAYDLADQFSSSSVDLSEEDAYIAPKIGFNAMISSNIGLGVEGKYNFFSPSGNSADDPLVGTLLKSYSIGFVLTVKL